jgi:hypothetical protein
MLIELEYQFYIHACSGNYLENIFLLYSSLFQFFCVKCPDDGLTVWTVRLIRPNIRSPCPDGRVFMIS